MNLTVDKESQEKIITDDKEKAKVLKDFSQI